MSSFLSKDILNIGVKRIYRGQKLQDGEKVLQMSQSSPHSKGPPSHTVGPSNLSFVFHLPGMILLSSMGLPNIVEIVGNRKK